MIRSLCFVVLSVSFAACSSDESSTADRRADPDATSAPAYLDGSLVTSIVAEDGSIELGLTDAVLYGRLTEQTISEVKDGLTEAEDEGGLGGFIAGAVSNAVSGAIATPIQIPLDDIETVRYEDDRLQVILKDQDAAFDVDMNGRDVDQLFAPEDAQAFADAFHDLTGR